MRFFLKAKNWQIFIIALIYYVIGFIFARSVTVAAMLLWILSSAGIFGWFWSVGVGLHPHLPKGVNIKTVWFKVFLIIPFVFNLLIGIIGITVLINFEGLQDLSAKIIIAYLYNAFIHLDIERFYWLLIGLFLIEVFLLAFSLFFVLAFVFACYFTARTYKTVELQRKVTFAEYSIEFILIFFLPIGIWILQPKLNQMVKD
jgi:hypothetical protein